MRLRGYKTLFIPSVKGVLQNDGWRRAGITVVDGKVDAGNMYSSGGMVFVVGVTWVLWWPHEQCDEARPRLSHMTDWWGLPHYSCGPRHYSCRPRHYSGGFHDITRVAHDITRVAHHSCNYSCSHFDARQSPCPCQWYALDYRLHCSPSLEVSLPMRWFGIRISSGKGQSIGYSRCYSPSTSCVTFCNFLQLLLFFIIIFCHFLTPYYIRTCYVKVMHKNAWDIAWET